MFPEITDPSSIFIGLTVLTVLALGYLRLRLGPEMTTDVVAVALGGFAFIQIVLAGMYAYPWQVARPGAWVLPVAALITVLFAFGIWTLGASQPTPAVQQYRENRDQRTQ